MRDLFGQERLSSIVKDSNPGGKTLVLLLLLLELLFVSCHSLVSPRWSSSGDVSFSVQI